VADKNMSTREEQLSRLHDGELEPDAAEQLRAELTGEEQQKLVALQEVDALLVNTLAAEAGSRKLDLWSAIESQLPELDSAADAPPATVRPLAPPAKVLPFLRRPSVRLTAVLSSLAAAAGLVLVLRSHPPQSNRCDIEELEVAGQSATVIAVPDDHGQETALIWFDHQETDEWESL
jgi:hypothetical protein